MKTWRCRLFALVMAAAATGCGDAPTGPSTKDGAAARVDLKLVAHADFDRLIESHRGSVVVIDFWASWCGPCRDRFPHLVELNHNFEDFGLVCVSASLDKEDDRGAALKFLKGQKAAFTNVLLKEAAPDEGQRFVQHYRYRGAIPHMVLFGRDGRLVWTSGDEPLSPGAVEALVRRELDKK